ncbi:MAG: flippase-like domain-containing protein [Chitinophagaceae bacterium]|nr:flippase-like domain-containing protein [Chitinophagaceae bacterium]MCB9055438.1 flippase-like domain-containing protein [Chitinophagales bacterium]
MRGRLMKVSKNIKFFINYFLGPVLFVWLAWSVYRQIMAQPDLGKAWQHVRQSFNSPLIWNLVIVVLLMFVNWAIEAVKWKISVKEVQEVNFAKAFMAVLSGVSFAVSTPNRVGEYLGRVLYMKEGNRLKTISITITGSISQLIITLFIGCIGLYVLRPAIIEQHLISSLWMQVIFYGVLATAIVLTVFYFRLSWLVKWIEKIPGSRRFVYLVEAIEHFDATLLIRLLSLSLLRFIVFIIQYYLLFDLFGVNTDWWQTFWTVSVSFLVMAIIPTISLLELVQRGNVVAAIVGLYSANIVGMSFATASIWFINLVIPAIAGSLLILRMRKIISEKNEEV